MTEHEITGRSRLAVTQRVSIPTRGAVPHSSPQADGRSLMSAGRCDKMVLHKKELLLYLRHTTHWLYKLRPRAASSCSTADPESCGWDTGMCVLLLHMARSGHVNISSPSPILSRLPVKLDSSRGDGKACVRYMCAYVYLPLFLQEISSLPPLFLTEACCDSER